MFHINIGCAFLNKIFMNQRATEKNSQGIFDHQPLFPCQNPEKPNPN